VQGFRTARTDGLEPPNVLSRRHTDSVTSSVVEGAQYTGVGSSLAHGWCHRVHLVTFSALAGRSCASPPTTWLPDGMGYATVTTSESKAAPSTQYHSAGFEPLAGDRRLRQADRLAGRPSMEHVANGAPSALISTMPTSSVCGRPLACACATQRSRNAHRE
jgi:hypothetical protein